MNASRKYETVIGKMINCFVQNDYTRHMVYGLYNVVYHNMCLFNNSVVLK